MEELLLQVIKRLDNLESKIDANHEEIIQKLNVVENKLDEIEPKNAVRHTEIYNEINIITKDVRFIKHKIHETEEDVFDIKDHLKLVK